MESKLWKNFKISQRLYDSAMYKFALMKKQY